MNTTSYTVHQEIRKERFFSPYHMVIEVTGFTGRPVRVSISSFFKKPLEGALERIVHVASRQNVNLLNNNKTVVLRTRSLVRYEIRVK